MVAIGLAGFQPRHIFGLECNRVVDGGFDFRGVFPRASGRIYVDSLNATFDDMGETCAAVGDG